MLDDGYSLKVGDVMFHRNPSDGSRQPAFVTDEAPDNVRLEMCIRDSPGRAFCALRKAASSRSGTACGADGEVSLRFRASNLKSGTSGMRQEGKIST